MKQHKAHLLSVVVFAMLAQNGPVTAVGPVPVGSVTVIVTTESHWIGVNTEYLTGEVQKGSIGINTELLTDDGGQTKWIGKNTQYITDIVQTTTISGAPTTVTNFPNIKIVGPVDEDGNPTGSFDVIMAPALALQVQEVANQHCPERSNANRTCSEDFAPRVQSLLRGGNDGVLTERFVVLASAALVMFIAIGIQMWLIAHREPLIPEIIHIDNIHTDNNSDSFRDLIFTTIPSHYVVTLTTFPKQTQVLSGTLPIATVVDEDKGGDCWLYVGVEPDPLNEDLNSEASDEDAENGPVTRRSLSPLNNSLSGFPNPDGDSRALRGNIAGRIVLPRSTTNFFSKRQGGPQDNGEGSSKDQGKDKGKKKGKGKKKTKSQFVNQIGNCEVKPTADHIVRAHKHPGPSRVMDSFNPQNDGWEHGINPDLWWFVPSQDFEGSGCPVAKLDKKGKQNPNSDDFSHNNFPVPYNQQTHLKSLNVDHIYESATIQQFFSSELKEANDPRCKDFVEMFDKPDTGLQQGKNSRFWSLWAQNSNPTPWNWAFAGLDERINNFKGYILNPNLEGWALPAEVTDSDGEEKFDILFQTWNNAALSLDFLNTQAVISYFAQRNNAVYTAFRDFDEIQRCGKRRKEYSELTSWAETYKKYMADLLTENQKLMRERIRAINTNILKQSKRMVDDNGKPNKYGKAYEKLNEGFSESFFTFKHADLLSYSPLVLGIRDLSSVLPAFCTNDTSTAPAKEQLPKGYCGPLDDPNICSFTTTYRWGEEPADLMGNNAYVYDNKCRQIGYYKGIKSGTSITSELPYTIELKYTEPRDLNLTLDHHLGIWFSYADLFLGNGIDGTGTIVDQKPAQWRHDCEVSNYSGHNFQHLVNRCGFKCRYG